MTENLLTWMKASFSSVLRYILNERSYAICSMFQAKISHYQCSREMVSYMRLLCTPIFILTNIYLLPWHLFCSLSCQDTLIVWCIYIYIDVQALIIK